MSLARLISPAAAAIRSLRASPALATQASKITSPRRFHHSDDMTATLDPKVLQRYLNLDSGGHVLATYIWIDGTGEGLRGKTRTMTSYPSSVEDLPIWNFDGSSTGQASGHDSDVYIHPVSIFKDPFMTGNNCLVMCETYDKHGKPHATNRRNSCMTVMKRAESTEPIFGFEQEYTLLDSDNHPYGWPKNGYVGPQGPYYCAVGTNRVFGRAVVEAHYKACLYAGIKIGGTNAEVMPSQWEYQVGPCMGIDMGDQLWVSRYILHRVAEDFGVVVSLDPKPMPGDWNGAGGHCNFSTAQMRADGGIEEVKKAIEKLSKVHHRHIKLYDPAQGADNRRRLTGHHETAHIGQFLSGVAHRGASIRIPRQCDKDGKGYLEDRRPSSNCDPYLVTEAIIRSSILEDWSDFDWSSFPEEK